MLLSLKTVPHFLILSTSHFKPRCISMGPWIAGHIVGLNRNCGVLTVLAVPWNSSVLITHLGSLPEGAVAWNPEREIQGSKPATAV